MSDHQLWFTTDRRQFWLMPADATLPLGPVRVRNLQLAARDVDPGALADHAVSRAEAAAWIDETVAAAMAPVQGVLGDLDPVAMLGVGDVLTDPEAVGGRLESARSRVAELLSHARPGDVADTVRRQVAALEEAIRDDDSDLARTLGAVEERLESAIPEVRERLTGLAERLRARLGRD